MANINVLKPFILQWEGGFANDPDDLGGATNKGVTLYTFRRFYGKDRTVEDLKNMTDAQWLFIFRNGYWDKWKADKIENQSVANLLVDWVYLSGEATIKRVQELLRVVADGKVGDITIARLNSLDSKQLFNDIKKLRIEYIDEICRKRPTNLKFRNGWVRRLTAITYKA